MSTTVTTKAIVVRRTNFGEADRILTLLTPDHGKVSAIAKAVRRAKSRLAGAVELFSVCDMSLVRGRGEMYTLTGSRIDTFYGDILKDYDRLQFAYYVLKDVAAAAETVPEPEFFDLANTSLWSLNRLEIHLGAVELYYRLHMAQLLGVGLNLSTDAAGVRLAADQSYGFATDSMSFVRLEHGGTYTAEHIKLLRVAATHPPAVIHNIKGLKALLPDALRVARTAHE